MLTHNKIYEDMQSVKNLLTLKLKTKCISLSFHSHSLGFVLAMIIEKNTYNKGPFYLINMVESERNIINNLLNNNINLKKF